MTHKHINAARRMRFRMAKYYLTTQSLSWPLPLHAMHLLHLLHPLHPPHPPHPPVPSNLFQACPVYVR